MLSKEVLRDRFVVILYISVTTVQDVYITSWDLGKHDLKCPIKVANNNKAPSGYSCAEC